MFTNESPMTSKENLVAPVTMTTDAGLAHLREIAQQHQVCYEVWPEWSMKEGRKLQIGFELQLCGVNSHAVSSGDTRHPVPGCQICLRTYNELREIAEWVLPVDERPSRYEIQAFDHAWHVAPAKRFRRNEVVLTIVIMHRDDFNQPVDDCESRCLKEMRQRLAQLGICEDVGREDKRGMALERKMKWHSGL